MFLNLRLAQTVEAEEDSLAPSKMPSRNSKAVICRSFYCTQYLSSPVLIINLHTCSKFSYVFYVLLPSLLTKLVNETKLEQLEGICSVILPNPKIKLLLISHLTPGTIEPIEVSFLKKIRILVNIVIWLILINIEDVLLNIVQFRT